VGTLLVTVVLPFNIPRNVFGGVRIKTLKSVWLSAAGYGQVLMVSPVINFRVIFKPSLIPGTLDTMVFIMAYLRLHDCKSSDVPSGITYDHLTTLIVTHRVTRYETKGVQPPTDVLKKLADVFGTSIDFLVNGTADEKAQTAFTDAELIKQFQEVEQLPETEKKTILTVLAAYTLDFKAKQVYVI